MVRKIALAALRFTIRTNRSNVIFSQRRWEGEGFPRFIHLRDIDAFVTFRESKIVRGYAICLKRLSVRSYAKMSVGRKEKRRKSF